VTEAPKKFFYYKFFKFFPNFGFFLKKFFQTRIFQVFQKFSKIEDPGKKIKKSKKIIFENFHV
tara:strand:- start:13 stop:201 length:189 start_codon:yes stop_codon:yes gene_type:complete